MSRRQKRKTPPEWGRASESRLAKLVAWFANPLKKGISPFKGDDNPHLLGEGLIDDPLFEGEDRVNPSIRAEQIQQRFALLVAEALEDATPSEGDLPPLCRVVKSCDLRACIREIAAEQKRVENGD